MKIDNDTIIMNTHRQTELSSSIIPKSYPESNISKSIEDRVDLSISGIAKSIKISVPIRKVRTAGLIITDLKVSRPSEEGSSIAFDKSIITVSNERAALGTSENRLRGNSRTIDNSNDKNIVSKESRDRDIAKELLLQTKNNMLQEASVTFLAQENSNSDAVLELLR